MLRHGIRETVTCLGNASSSLWLEHREGLEEWVEDESREVNRGVHQAKELGGIILSKPGVGKLHVKPRLACCLVL